MTVLASLLLASLLVGCVQNGRSCKTGASTPGRAVPLPVTADVTLCAQVFGSGATAVVLAHARGSDRRSWYPFAQELAQRGHSVLAFDFRGYGDSTGRRDDNNLIDLRVAIDYERAEGATRIVVIGASFGGTAAIIAASDGPTGAASPTGGARPAGIAAVASISGPNVWRKLDAVTAAEHLSVPALFAVARSDEPYTSSIRQQAERAGVQALEIDGSAHGTALVAASAELRNSLIRLVEAAP